MIEDKEENEKNIEFWKWLYEETIRLFKLGSDNGYNDFTLLKKANDILEEIERESL